MSTAARGPGAQHADADAVTVDALVKRFGAITALDRVSFSVRAGELFGFIGPDGGGKTTLIRILTTLLVPNEGTARVLGQDVVKGLWTLRRRIGYMPGRCTPIRHRGNLRFFARCSALPGREYLDRVHLFADRPSGSRAAAVGRDEAKAAPAARLSTPEILFLVNRRPVSMRRGAVDLRRLSDRTDDRRLYPLWMGDPRLVALVQRGACSRSTRRRRSHSRSIGRCWASARTTGSRARLRDYPQTHTIYPFGDVLHYTEKRQQAAPDQIARRDGVLESGVSRRRAAYQQQSKTASWRRWAR